LVVSEKLPIFALDLASHDQGKKQNGMQRGINIVRYSDGTTKKVMVR
jgi:hypothetical protein